MYYTYVHKAYLVAEMVKNLPAMQEIWVWSLGQEDSLEKGTAIPTPVFLPGEFHGQRSQMDYSPWGHTESDLTEKLTFSLHSSLFFNFDTHTHISINNTLHIHNRFTLLYTWNVINQLYWGKKITHLYTVNVGYKSFDPNMLSSPFPGLAVSTASLPLRVSLHPNPCLRVYIYVFIHIYFIFGCDGSSLRCAASLLLRSGFLSVWRAGSSL